MPSRFGTTSTNLSPLPPRFGPSSGSSQPAIDQNRPAKAAARRERLGPWALKAAHASIDGPPCARYTTRRAARRLRLAKSVARRPRVLAQAGYKSGFKTGVRVAIEGLSARTFQSVADARPGHRQLEAAERRHAATCMRAAS